MTARTTARHRAEAPVSTPLTTVTAALAEKVPTTTAARSGLVLAVSSGLVAGVGLPAQAAPPRGDEATTASLKLPALAPAVDQVALDQAVSAPSTARVTFERNAMSASLKRAVDADSTARAADAVATVSRSLARAAYGQQVAQARRAEQVQQRTTATRISRDAPRTAPTPVSVPSNGSLGSKVIAIASRYFGVPYRYGGTTPRGFDCSGLVQYVYKQLGISLPRTAQQQYGATTRISRSQAKPGDLVFFFGGGGISHVGIYAGGNMMIAAPRTGTVVRKQPIYSSNVAFGRVSG